MSTLTPITSVTATPKMSALSANDTGLGQQGGFADALKQALDSVNTMQGEAADLSKEVQLGNPNVSLEETVIAQAKASVAFQAVVQTRNKLVTAYHDIMNMQI
jgi:flagellar hook-basal body complex protein FliE